MARRISMRNTLDGPIFEPLKDLEYFRRFTVNQDIDTVTWPNEADFSPDFLYEIGIEFSDQSAPRDDVSTARKP